MFITLIGTIAAGFLGAGCVLILRFLLKERVPGWALPVAAGGFMLAATISSEYGWYPNTAASLPAGVEVVETFDFQAAWKPWTYLSPYVHRFVAIDSAGMRVNAATPDLRIVDLYLYARWQPVEAVQMAVDCGQNLRADPAEGISMDADGRPEGVTWREVPEDDTLIMAACG